LYKKKRRKREDFTPVAPTQIHKKKKSI